MRKWATLLTSTLALLVTSLRDPIGVSIKTRQDELLRRELSRYETGSATDARWTNTWTLKASSAAFGSDIAPCATESLPARRLTNCCWKMHTCLTAVETKLDLLMKERQRDRLQSSAARSH